MSKCRLCKSKTARFLPSVQDRQGSSKDPEFCSIHCAAVWACIHAKYDEQDEFEIEDSDTD